MERPFADKRPIGPFAQRGRVNKVLLSTDFNIHKVKMADGSMEAEPRVKDQMADLNDLVLDVGQDVFSSGEVADVRIEDHAVNGQKGIRVVYSTDINAVFKEDIDEFESGVKNALANSTAPFNSIENEFSKITVVATQ